MTTRLIHAPHLAAVLAGALALGTTATQAQDLATHFGPVTLDAKGYPDQKGIDTIYDELDFQRACQAYVWALPAVGMEGQFLMQKHFGATGPLLKPCCPRSRCIPSGIGPTRSRSRSSRVAKPS